jgi:hypothetical protein
LYVFSAWEGQCGHEAGKSEQVRESQRKLEVILESRFFHLSKLGGAGRRVRQDSEGLLFAVMTETLFLRMAIPVEIPTPAEISQREERAILWVTCLAAFLVFNSFEMALPAIQSEFGNSRSELQWVTLMGVVTISSL